MLGRYGSTRRSTSRHRACRRRRSAAVVRSYMAHHQGMILAALDNLLERRLAGAALPRRAARPDRRAAALRAPGRGAPRSSSPSPAGAPRRPRCAGAARDRSRGRPRATRAFPQVHVLSNGRYSVLVTEGGGGGSRWQDLALTRWAPIPTLDDDGFRLYLRDLGRGGVLVAVRDADAEPHRQVLFQPHMVGAPRAGDDDLACAQRVCVAPDADVEIRQLTAQQRERRAAPPRVTSYARGRARRRGRRPPPSGLQQAVRRERVPATSCTRCSSAAGRARRRRVALCLVHMPGAAAAGGARPAAYETLARALSRTRGRAARRPPAFADGGRRSRRDRGRHARSDHGAVGRRSTCRRIRSRDARFRHRRRRLARGGRRRSRAATARSTDLEWTVRARAGTDAERELADLGLASPRPPRGQQLLSLAALSAPRAARPADVLGPQPARAVRASGSTRSPAISRSCSCASPGRRGHAAPARRCFARTASGAERGVAVDLVMLERARRRATRQTSTDRIARAIAAAGAEAWTRPAGRRLRHPRRPDHRGRPHACWLAAARVVLDASAADSSRPSSSRDPAAEPPACRRWSPPLPDRRCRRAARPRPNGLLFDNGLGGFTPDGREYVDPSRSRPSRRRRRG